MITKEIKDLTGFDISTLKDKKARIKLVKKSLPFVAFGYVGDLLAHAYRTSTAAGAMGRLKISRGKIILYNAHLSFG